MSSESLAESGVETTAVSPILSFAPLSSVATAVSAVSAAAVGSVTSMSGCCCCCSPPSPSSLLLLFPLLAAGVSGGAVLSEGVKERRGVGRGGRLGFSVPGDFGASLSSRSACVSDTSIDHCFMHEPASDWASVVWCPFSLADVSILATSPSDDMDSLWVDGVSLSVKLTDSKSEALSLWPTVSTEATSMVTLGSCEELNLCGSDGAELEGKAVLQGMGPEITTDFLFLDLVLHRKRTHTKRMVVICAIVYKKRTKTRNGQ